MSKVRKRNELVAYLSADLFDFLVRAFEKIIQQAKFVNHFESRRVDRIAAKVAEEIGMFLQHNRIDSRPRQQKAEHYAGWSTTHDAAAGADDFI